MSIDLDDPKLIEKFLTVQDPTDVRDAAGKVIGQYTPVYPGRLPPGVTVPFTADQTAEFRKATGGRPLADILRDLETRG